MLSIAGASDLGDRGNDTIDGPLIALGARSITPRSNPRPQWQ